MKWKKSNQFDFLNVHGIMNTSGLLQSKREALRESMNITKIEFIALFGDFKLQITSLFMTRNIKCGYSLVFLSLVHMHDIHPGANIHRGCTFAPGVYFGHVNGVL